MRKDKPSMTARKVALNIVTLGAKQGMENVLPAGLVETTAEILVASGTVSPKTIRWARSQRMVSIYEWFDWMLPGQFEAFGHRKAFCERQVRDGISSGATQVLVLGAGYDMIGWRLAPEFPIVNFFEIDHPATARLKAKGVETMGLRDNLFLIAEDLGKQKLVDVIKTTKTWEQNEQTVIIAEGLVMYLTSEAVRDMFSQCSEVAGAGSSIAFSYIPTGVDGRPNAGAWTGLMLWLQKVIGEPWVWSIRPEDLGTFLEETGWLITPAMAGTNRMHGVECYAVATKAL
jgi:methyltransferase (TIGR00027 family)